MTSFTITFTAPAGPSTTSVTCDGYAQEGPMITFFAFGPDSDTIDSWSRRVASFRTQDVTSVVRHDAIGDEVFRNRHEAPVLVAV